MLFAMHVPLSFVLSGEELPHHAWDFPLADFGCFHIG